MTIRPRVLSTRSVVSLASGVQDSRTKRFINGTRPPPSMAGVTEDHMRDPANVALRFNQLAAEVHRATEVARSGLTAGAQSIEGLKFTNGSPIVINHGLNQPILGWQLVRPRGQDRILDVVETASTSTQLTLQATVGTLVRGSFAPQGGGAPSGFTGYGYTTIARTGAGLFAITVPGTPSLISAEFSLQMSVATDLKLLLQPTTVSGGNTIYTILVEQGAVATDIIANASHRIFFTFLLSYGGCTADVHVW